MQRRSFLSVASMAPSASSPLLAAPPRTPVTGNYDVVVCGGGTAGLPAAIAAARCGARVAIVERYGFLGGSPATSIMPTWHGLGYHHSGLLTEFSRRVEEFGLGPKPLENNHMEPEAVKILFLKLALENNIDIHLHRFIVDVARKGNAVIQILTQSKSGPEAFGAKVFIDATGDGDVGYHAGVKCLKGDNGKTQGMALRFRMGQVDIPLWLEWGKRHLQYFRNAGKTQLDAMVEKARRGQTVHIPTDMSRVWENDPDPELPRDTYFVTSSIRPNELSVNATRIYGVDATSARDLTKAEIATRLQVFAIWRYLKKNIPGFENSIVTETAFHVGVRESRAVVGDYIVTKDDFLSTREFEDSVLTCRVSFDSHDPKNYQTQRIPNGVVDIPYRCFLAKGVDGLLVAGRCLSSDHLANSAIRRMESAFQTGEVAGTAAYLAAKAGKTPRQIAVSDLQAELIKNGFHVSQKRRREVRAWPFDKKV